MVAMPVRRGTFSTLLQALGPLRHEHP
jgi:hypothetical protein